MATNGIQTHACTNQRHTLDQGRVTAILKSLQAFNIWIGE